MLPDRDLDRELRDLGSRLEYPPVPDLARSVRSRLEAEDGTSGSWRSRSRPQLWWIAAAALILIVGVPVFSLAMRDMVGGAFSAGGGAAGSAARSGGQDEAAAGPTRLSEEDGSLAAGADGDASGGAAQESITDGSGGAGQMARPNGPVPDVVGMGLTAACEKLASRDYVGYVIRAVDDPGAGPGRVVGQRPPAGRKGYVGEPVDLTVSEPYSEDVLRGLSRGRNPACLDATG
jgi:hypothetical protein